MNLQESRALYPAHRATLERKGLITPGVTMYTPDEWKHDYDSATMAMDAAGTLTTDPNSALPTQLTTTIDPDVIRVVFAPMAFGEMLGERKAGDWLSETRMFPVVEATGEVSSYGDFNNNGRAGINMNWPNFQSYLFQTFQIYGERELERAGLAKINYVSELNQSAAMLLNRFQNLTYAFGVQGLQNYGIINNPYLSASLTPTIKAATGGTAWFNNGAPAATANEVYNDILALVEQVISQTNGAFDMDSKMTLALSPQSALAMKFANSYGVYVSALLKEGFPNMTVKQAPQYGQKTAANNQGFTTAGNFVQLIADQIDGQKVAYAAFTEKMRAHKIIPEPSSWKQKTTSGTWGTILRMPLGIASMIGV